MELKKIRIGDYIELYSEKCGIPNLTVDDVSGINRDKEFFEPSKQVGSDTSKYKVVPPGYFACNLMHVGRDEVLPVAINKTNKNKIVSPAYTVFRVKNEDTILAYYLFILLNSDEKDRYFWFHCDSSVRDGMEWSSFCDIELEVPSIDIQKKYVAIYISLLSNLNSYEKGLEDLKLVCDAYIEKLKKNNQLKPLKEYIDNINEKNKNLEINLEQGVNIKKVFIEPQRENSDLSKRKIVRTGDIVYCTQLNNENVAVAYREGQDCVVSSVYDVIRVKNVNILNPKYLFLWLARAEFGRFVYWKSTGTSYEFLNYEEIEEYCIPIPSIEIQNSIVAVYNSMEKRINYITILKKKIASICPILIRGAVKESKGGN